MKSKQRLVLNYSELTPEIKDMVKRIYPEGFKKHLLTIPKQKGGSYKAFTMDTGNILYLIKVEDRFLKSADELIANIEAYQPNDDEMNY